MNANAATAAHIENTTHQIKTAGSVLTILERRFVHLRFNVIEVVLRFNFIFKFTFLLMLQYTSTVGKSQLCL